MWRRYQKTFIYALIFLIPVIIFFTRPKNLKANFLVAPALAPAHGISGIIKEWQKLWYYRETYDHYMTVKRRYEVLTAKYIALNAGLDNEAREKSLENYKKRLSYPMISATVIGRDPSDWNAALIVNKGQNQGVKVGMPVVTDVGVVGRVVEIGKSTSKVMMLSDANFALAAMVERSGESGLLKGSLQGLCRLEYLTDKADVQIGDNVLTSTLSTAFPPEILIGRVVDVQASTVSHSVECLVEPVVGLSQVKEVIIIKSFGK